MLRCADAIPLFLSVSFLDKFVLSLLNCVAELVLYVRVWRILKEMVSS